jgi:hypothetical protein
MLLLPRCVAARGPPHVSPPRAAPNSGLRTLTCPLLFPPGPLPQTRRRCATCVSLRRVKPTAPRKSLRTRCACARRGSTSDSPEAGALLDDVPPAPSPRRDGSRWAAPPSPCPSSQSVSRSPPGRAGDAVSSPCPPRRACCQQAETGRRGLLRGTDERRLRHLSCDRLDFPGRSGCDGRGATALGSAYKGLGVPKDVARAVALLKQAAAEGCKTAADNLRALGEAVPEVKAVKR